MTTDTRRSFRHPDNDNIVVHVDSCPTGKWLPRGPATHVVSYEWATGVTRTIEITDMKRETLMRLLRQTGLVPKSHVIEHGKIFTHACAITGLDELAWMAPA